MPHYPTIGNIIRQDPALDGLIAPDAKIELLTDGLVWSEGPVWSTDGGYLLFSDIPRNTIFKWSEGAPVTTYMRPSGYTGVVHYSAEAGSNGLTFDSEGRLTACEHGDRRISRLEHSGGKKTLADTFEGKRLNSPNDLVYRSTGDLFFTDPAYGLPGRYEDTANRELDFCGVFHLSPSGDLNLLTDELTNPNGLAFSVDESILYVGQSNRERAIWMAYLVRPDGSIDKGEVFCDVTELAGGELPGAPDGFKLDAKGNMFATGPGGVYVISAGGKILGRIDPGKQSANVAWGDDGSMLYITAHSCLCRIQTLTTAAVMP